MDARLAKERAYILAAKIEEDAPLVDFAERLESSPTTHLVGSVAKMIQQGTGIAMGQNRLFVWLRENRYLHQTGSRKNQPTQRSLDQGWFSLQVRNVEIKNESRVRYTTRVTGKGLFHLYEQFYLMAVELGLKPRMRPEMVTSAETLQQLPPWEDEYGDFINDDLLTAARRRVNNEQ
jgi:phage antirepressor YoqD-like protein